MDGRKLRCIDLHLNKGKYVFQLKFERISDGFNN